MCTTSRNAGCWLWALCFISRAAPESLLGSHLSAQLTGSTGAWRPHPTVQGVAQREDTAGWNRVREKPGTQLGPPPVRSALKGRQDSPHGVGNHMGQLVSASPTLPVL